MTPKKRKRGRPRSKAGTYRARLDVRVTPDMLAALKRHALADNESLAEWVRRKLQWAMDHWS